MTSVVIIVVLAVNFSSFTRHTILSHQSLQLSSNLMSQALCGLTTVHNDEVQSGLSRTILCKVLPQHFVNIIIVNILGPHRFIANTINTSSQASVILQTHQVTSILGNGAVGIKDESSHNVARSNLQRMVIELVGNLVQHSLQASISGNGQSVLLSSIQLAVDSSSERIINGGHDGIIALVIIAVVAGGIASGQHTDSHNAGQSQRSNLLEFHNEIFLLMVYKR